MESIMTHDVKKRAGRRTIGILIFAVIVIAFSVWVVQKIWFPPKPKGVIRLAGVPAAFYLPLMVAHDQALFERYGLKSEIVLFNNNNDMMNALLHGDVDLSGLGSGGSFSLEAQSPGRVRFVYGQNNRSYSFIVPKDSRIEKLEDLRGKKIGTWPSPTPRVCLHLILDGRIGKDGFEIVPVEFRFLNQAMKRGDVDALFNTDVFTQQAIQSGEARYLSKVPLEEYVRQPFFNGGGLITRDLERRKPQIYHTILQVVEDAVQFIRDHEEEARSSLVKHIGVNEEVAAQAPIDQFILLSEVDLSAAQEVADILYQHGAVPKKVEVGPMFH
jgi:ABC-type nitrate/sulfonate/bicarbonate transport system substrate-binding protein